MKTSSVETSLTRETTGSVRFDRGPAGHDWLTTARASAVLGGLMIAAGLLVSSAGLAAFLRGASGPLSGQLILGATLFRIGLVVLGAAIIALGNVRIWTAVPEEQSAPANSSGKLVPVVLTLIIGVATALRLYGLNAGLWYDEIVTDVLYARLPYGSIVTTFDSENQHFLYSILAHTSIQVFGESAWALRLPAALFGIAGIWALYLLGAEVANSTEALLAAALLTFSYTGIWFSQNARGYSGLLCMAILATWLFLRAVRAGQPRPWLLYAIAAALGLYIHVTMVFVVVTHFLVYAGRMLAQRRRRWPNRWAGLFLGFGFAGLFTFQLYALVLPQVVGGMGREPSAVEEWKNPLWTVLEIAKGLQANFAGGIVVIAALVVFGIGIFSYARTYRAMIAFLVVSAVLGAAVVIGLGHPLWPRFFLFIMGFGALVVVRGTIVCGRLAARIARLPRRYVDAVGVALCVGLILVSARSIPAAYRPKQDYVGAADYIRANLQPGDAVVVAGLAAFPYTNLYDENWPDVESVAALDAVRARATHTWLVYSFTTVLQAEQPAMMDVVDREFRVVKTFDGSVDGGAIVVTRADGAPADATTK
ncbi:MAG TPA: glycosyltransferase family 39 protein [Chloroflexota bacterium]|nr:glycosyltransferase family 39 protein [Chloroflexota bacterium]